MNESQGNAKLYSILAYIAILWLVGMFVSPEKDDPFVRFHVNQGIILFLAEVALGIITAIISWLAILNIAILVWFIIGVVHAARGEMKPLPLIGGFELYK